MKPYEVSTTTMELEDAAAVILNWPDCASILFKFSVFVTKLTRKPVPVGHPPLGGLQVVFPRVPSTSAARTWSFAEPSF